MSLIHLSKPLVFLYSNTTCSLISFIFIKNNFLNFFLHDNHDHLSSLIAATIRMCNLMHELASTQATK